MHKLNIVLLLIHINNGDGQMIDLTNKPEGATHYYTSLVREHDCYIKGLTPYKYFYWDAKLSIWCVGGNRLVIDNCKPIESLTIYNNTLPLSELSDEQLGKLLRHNISDGNIEYKSADGWIHPPAWVDSGIYRAKQKSERELFIDAAKKSASLRARDGADTVYGELFDSGFKAPKVGE